MRQAEIPVADVMAPAKRQVNVLLLGVRFVLWIASVDCRLSAQPTVFAGERPLPEIRQDVELPVPPIAEIVEVQHWLTELFLAVDILHEVCLVDDIHQVLGFRYTPENNVNPDLANPAIVLNLPVQLSYIGVCSLVVGRVVAEKRCEYELLITVCPVSIVLGLECE